MFGKRFSDEIVAALLQLRWWDLDHGQIESLRPLLLGTEIELFIRECRKLKGLPPVEKLNVVAEERAAPARLAGNSVPASGDGPTELQIREWCAGFLAKQLKVSPAQVDPEAKFKRLGIDSTTSIILSIELGEWLGLELSSNIIFDHPTINDLARHLVRQLAGTRPDRGAR